MTASTFPCFIKKTQINPEFFNFSMYQGWDDFCDQSVVCQDISKVPCFLNSTTDISVLMGMFHNSLNSVKVPYFVNLHFVMHGGMTNNLAQMIILLRIMPHKQKNMSPDQRSRS